MAGNAASWKQHSKMDSDVNCSKKNLSAKGIRLYFVPVLVICFVVVFFFSIGSIVKYRGRCDQYEIKSRRAIKSENVDGKQSTEKPWKQILLPVNIRPKHYDMLIQVSLKELTFFGKSTISIQVTISTRFIIFHEHKLRIRNVQLLDPSQEKRFKIRKQFEYKKNQFFVVELVDKLDVGEYKLKLNFDGDIKTKELNGFYRSTYKSNDGKTRILALTDFAPADARKAFPCFDEPAMKATFTISIEHDKKYTALSNMNVNAKEKVSNSRILTKFAKSVRMPTYLVAYVISDFKHLKTTTGKYNNITIRSWASPNQYEDSAYALGVGKSIITFYENYYGIPYPLPKQDMIAAPDFSSMAMENWGIVTYREVALLYKPGVSSALNKKTVTHVVAHELAHMWFGNLVSCFWWNDLWLNEGFASYMEYLGANHAQPTWEYLDEFLISDLYPAFRLDALSSSHPISVTVETPSDIATIFDQITYCKGASIIRMLSDVLGEPVFRKGVKNYLNKHKFGNAKSKDLWDALREVSGIDVGKIMDSWTNQMGFPVVHVSRKNLGKGKAKQKHFLLNANDVKHSDPRNSWYIRFSYTVEGNARAKMSLWMNKTSAVFDWPNGKWLKANLKQLGYYIVNYDKENWEMLSSVLRNNHKILSPSDRTSLIHDAFTLARAGQLDYDLAFNLALYIKKESKFVPWRTLLDSIEYLENMLRKQDVYGRFKKFVLHILESNINRIEWAKSSKDRHHDINMRTMILNAACSYGHKMSIEKGKKLFLEYLNSGNQLDVDLRNIIYYHGIANTGRKEWQKLFEIYQNTTVASQRVRLLHGLSASKDHTILLKFLKHSVDESKVRSQDTVTVINYIAQNPIGENLAWKFFTKNWQLFYQRYSKVSFRLASLITGTTSTMNTKNKLTMVKDFFKGRDTGSGTRAVDESIERIKVNIDWMERSPPQIKRYFNTK